MLEETQAPHCQGCSSSTYIVHPGDYGSRGQIDLIDMQSMPNGHHKWIMVYQDHLTKYCILRPLSTKRAAEVAYQLMDIFLLFGAPQIMQSDNGSEFTVAVISELKLLWPDLLMVHVNPRHPSEPRICWATQLRRQRHAYCLQSTFHHIRKCIHGRNYQSVNLYRNRSQISGNMYISRHFQ